MAISVKALLAIPGRISFRPRRSDESSASYLDAAFDELKRQPLARQEEILDALLAEDNRDADPSPDPSDPVEPRAGGLEASEVILLSRGRATD